MRMMHAFLSDALKSKPKFQSQYSSFQSMQGAEVQALVVEFAETCLEHLQTLKNGQEMREFRSQQFLLC